MSDDTAHQARKALVDSVKGKVKEVAGAVTGNDSLTKEGRLEQAEAGERRDAIRVDAEADVDAADARERTREAGLEAAEQRLDAETRAATRERDIEADAARQQRAVAASGAQATERAEAAIDRDAQRAQQQAEAVEKSRFETAAKEYVDGVDEHARATADAEHTEAEAARLHREAERITDANDLN